MASSLADSAREMARVRQMIEYLTSHLREREPRLDDAEARRLFAQARETLAELHGKIAAYGKPHALHAAREAGPPTGHSHGPH